MAEIKKTIQIVLDDKNDASKHEISDFREIHPDYRLLSDALKEGRSWYDIIYPRSDGLVGTLLSQKLN
jgi:hypothetical protein